MVYNRFKTSDDIIYSIDYLQIDFHPIGYTPTKLFNQIIDSFENLTITQRQKQNIEKGQKQLKDYLLHWFQFDHFHVELWRLDKGPQEGKSTIRFKFNPNKCKNNEALEKAMHYFAENEYMWHYTRVDYTCDVVGNINEFYVLTRKTEHNYSTTRYYGTRGTSGYLRVYDKREEVKQKDKEDIGIELTRFEWEQRGNRDLEFTFDSFSRMDESGLDASSRILKYVAPELLNTALEEFERHARNRIKKKLFTPIKPKESLFVELLNEYEAEYGLQGYRAYTQEQLIDNVRGCEIDLEKIIENAYNEINKMKGEG